jgi:hypothetical protein
MKKYVRCVVQHIGCLLSTKFLERKCWRKINICSVWFASKNVFFSFWTSLSRKKFLGLKNTLMRTGYPGSGVFLTLDPGSGMEKMWNRDPG